MDMRAPTRIPKRERGTTLLIALVFLVILTLFAVSGMNTGIVNLRSANNAQMMVEAEYASQQLIEQTLSSGANFHFIQANFLAWAPATTTTNVDVNGDGITDFVVVANRPRCINVKRILASDSDEAGRGGSVDKEYFWEVTATVSDSVFGTSVTMREGIRNRLSPEKLCDPT